MVYYNWKLNCLLRVLHAVFLVQTFYSPDEYFQSLEIAHRYVFGYGYVTWEWREQIRSFVHPLIFVVGYQLLKVLNMDHRIVVYYTPKIICGLLAAVHDHFMFKLGELFNTETANKLYLLGWVSWYNLYSLTRSFSNSLETILTAVSLYYYTSFDSSFIYFVGITCMIRPTTALIWIVPSALFLKDTPLKRKFLSRTLLTLVLSLIAMVLIDYLYYNKIVFTPFKFLEFNLLKNLSAFYGRHSWGWMFYNGYPVITFTFLPLILYAMYRSEDNAPCSSTLMIFSGLLLNSITEHKEHRFVHPLLCPSLLLVARAKFSKWVINLAMITNVLLGVYVCLIHQSGVTAVVNYMADHMQPNSTAYFLMPCHSTPFYSSIHRSDVELEFITCEPPLNGEDLRTYKDESDYFYENPVLFLKSNRKIMNSDYLVLFEGLVDTVDSFKTHVPIASFFNSHFHDDPRRAGDVYLYKRNSIKSE